MATFNDYKALAAPKIPVTVIPTDADGKMIKDATRKWDTDTSPRTFEEHLFYCLSRSGKRAHHIDIAGPDGTIIDELDVGAVQMMREAAKAAPKPKKTPAVKATPKAKATPSKAKAEPKAKRTRKPKEKKPPKTPRTKGDKVVGATFAAAAGLPTRVGVFALAQETLGSKNPVSDDGWTIDEAAKLVSKALGRPIEGVKTTIRCQISRRFEAKVEIKKTREGKVYRYKISKTLK